MPVRQHLVELRRRVALAGAGILVGAVGGWFAYDWVLSALMEPLARAAAVNQGTVTLNFATVAASFDIKIQVAALVGLLVSSPCWLWQLWGFVAPALSRREKWRAAGFVGAGVPLLLGGAWLAWWALPNAVELLTAFTPDGAVNLIDAEAYLGFVVRRVGAFALAFCLPVLMVALSLAGVVSARRWARGWRWAVFAAFAFAAIASPTPDVLTMFLLAVPICALYGVAVAIAALGARRAGRRAARLARQLEVG
jgi:sec-independent protein translocase protein TatC